MPHNRTHRGRANSGESGTTLLELIIVCAILIVLSAAALPIARHGIAHRKEMQLKRDLLEMRDAIDRYKSAADRNMIRVDPSSGGYPPDLETLVNGVQLGPSADRRIRFLRRIPVDPMTGRAEWGLRSVGDDFDSTSWGGGTVFDVYSKSQATAADGTRYADW